MAALNWKPFKKDICSVCRAMSNTTIHNRLGDFLISSHVYLRYYTYSLFKMTCFYIILIINRSNRLLPCCWRVKCFTFLSCWIRPFTDSRALLFTSFSKISILNFVVVVLVSPFVRIVLFIQTAVTCLKDQCIQISLLSQGAEKKKQLYRKVYITSWFSGREYCLRDCWLCACLSILKILISRSSFQTSTNFVRQTKQKKDKKI